MKPYAKGGIGTRPLARMYGCSRSLVCLLVNPERAERNRERIKAHWRKYSQKYGKAAHAAAIRKTRNYKYGLYLEKGNATQLDTSVKDMV